MKSSGQTRDDGHFCVTKNFPTPTNIVERVYRRQIALERLFVRASAVYGTVRVDNWAFHKRVFVKSTTDGWKTTSTIDAYHSMYHPKTNTDSFQFKLTLASRDPVVVTFALCLAANGREYWDNNESRDYRLELSESSQSEPSLEQIAQDYRVQLRPADQRETTCALKNLGGACYMNAVLQSLSFTSSLTNYFLSNEQSAESHGIVTDEFRYFLHLLCSGRYSLLVPAPFKQVIGHVHRDYLGDQQQDAHEFLMVLLDKLQTRPMIESQKNDASSSFIEDLFYGQYRSTVTCLQCSQSTSSFEPFASLSLSIPDTDRCTLADCFEPLTHEEYLTEDSKWFCPRCSCLCNAKKSLEIDRFPKVLIVQLKRFQPDTNLSWRKNQTLVDYPSENLDLIRASYTLYAVINHNGSLDDGHYTVFCRDISSKSPQWFDCDDHVITDLRDEDLHSNRNAYLLFYTMNSHV